MDASLLTGIGTAALARMVGVTPRGVLLVGAMIGGAIAFLDPRTLGDGLLQGLCLYSGCALTVAVEFGIRVLLPVRKTRI